MAYEEIALATVDDVYAKMRTGTLGLSSGEASARLGKYGSNVLPSARKASLVGRFLAQLVNLFNVLLLLAAGLSFISAVAYNDPGSYRMGYALVAVVLTNVLFSLFQENRAEKAVQAIARLIPSKTKVVRDGEVKEVDAWQVVPGDVVALDEGDRVPADIRLVAAFEVSVDSSVLTGESEPQRRFAVMTPGMTATTLTDYQNMLFAGTVMVTGVARGVVLRTGADTQFGKVVRLSNEIEEPLSPLQKEINYTAKMNMIVAVIVGAVFFAVALAFVGLTLLESLLFAIGVMVSLVPEGFQLTVSLSLALTALAMAKKHVLVKRLSSVETVGLMTALGTDKTGTITSGEMMVQSVWTAGRTFEVSGDGYSPRGFVTRNGRKTDKEERPSVLRLFEVAAFCTNAKLNPPSDRIGRWSVLGDPTDGAFLVFAGKGDFNVSQALAENRRLLLIPFNSQRRMMTAVFRKPDGRVVAYTKGASEEVLSRCTDAYVDNEVVPLKEQLKEEARSMTNEFASMGYRVLALASRELEGSPGEGSDVERDMTFLGLAALADPPRPKVEEAVREARRAGIKIVMLTGDHEFTADAVARKVGIVTSEDAAVVPGSELERMGEAELADLLSRDELVFARITPEQKLRLVKALRARGETVAVTGDGVNDAPALREADVGISMGAGGTDVARESADMVLLDNNFASIIEGVKLGRATFENLRNFVYYVFTHNWAELFTFLVFVLFHVPLPLSVMQVLAIDLVMDVLPSLSLIMEPPSPQVMERRARAKRERLIDVSILVRSLLVGSVISAWVLFWALHIWASGGWGLGMAAVPDAVAYARGTTAVMAGIMAAQLGNMLSARTGLRSAFRSDFLRNKWILVGILGQIGSMLMIVYLPFVQPVFGTAGLSAVDWLELYAIAPVVFVFGEAIKAVQRRKRGETTSGPHGRPSLR